MSVPSFEFEGSDGLAIPILTKGGTIPAATAGLNVIAAVTGKRHRILSMTFCSAGAQSKIIVYDGSTGAVLQAPVIPLNTTAQPNVIFPAQRTGWGDTSAGQAVNLACGAVDVDYSINYITYTQADA